MVAINVQDHGISVNVGDDGAWVCFKTASGKSFVFQPLQEWPQGSHWHATIKEWCQDMKAVRASQNFQSDDSPPSKP